MSNLSRGYGRTMVASFIGYFVQAAICTLAPLLYVRFQTELGLPLSRISLLITITFLVQLLVDLTSPLFVHRLGARTCVLLAHFVAAVGFALLAVLPDRTSDPFAGLVIATVFYSVGAGLIEVLISPIIDACPFARKNAAMNLLHSFFCWGQLSVALLSTAFFRFCGIEHWRTLCLLWAALPLLNGVLFAFSPIPSLESEDGEKIGIRPLLQKPSFWIFFVMMLCAGASEQAVSQWVSALVETELGVSKTVGDLAGLCLFALFMALGRIAGTRFEGRVLAKVLATSGALCIVGYLLIALAPLPWLSLAGCALCGLAVSVTWPMSLSLAAQELRGAGTTLFALLALGGDVGCTTGPGWAGFAAEQLGGSLKHGILCAIIFPLGLLLAAVYYQRRSRRV